MSKVRSDNYGNRDGSSSITADTLLQGTAKAWFNLNGTGTIAARDSFNVSSFVDNGAGDYTAVFAVTQPSVNYGGYLTKQNNTSNADSCSNDLLSGRTSGQMHLTLYEASSLTDSSQVSGSILGDPV